MTFSRRTVLLGAAAACSAPSLSIAGPVPRALRAEPGNVQLAPEAYAKTAIWGYQGSVPGTELRVSKGARLTIAFENGLPQPSTVHWHGIRIDNAMDGVPGLTQAAVEPGDTFLYDFVLPDAGTYWYHPHNRTWEQLARGLYGTLVVEEPNGPEVDHDLVLLLDDWRLEADGSIDESFGQMRDWSHGGRIGNWITVNGLAELKQSVRLNDRLRLRLVNTANARIFSLGLNGLTGWVVALDGQPLREPMPADRLTLAPAQRADLLADITGGLGEEAMLVSYERDGGYPLASFTIGDGPRVARPAPAALDPNALTEPDLQAARPIELTMSGGAMGGMASAIYNGKDTPIRDLVNSGLVWAFNGVAGMPEEPLARVSRDEILRIKIVNDTGWPHAMHLHGHHFRVLQDDGTLGPWRDTVLINRAQTREIVFAADNPGKWLFHCHMVEHAASGMMTWLDVTT